MVVAALIVTAKDRSNVFARWHQYAPPHLIHGSLDPFKSVLQMASQLAMTNTHTHTHPFNGPLSGTTQVSWYPKGKTNFTGARDSEWQWHQLSHMQVCTSLQTDNHASTSLLKFFTNRIPFLPPNQQRQALKAYIHTYTQTTKCKDMCRNSPHLALCVAMQVKNSNYNVHFLTNSPATFILFFQ